MRNKIIQYLVLLPVIALIGCVSAPTGDKVRTEIGSWTEDFAALALVAKPEYRPAMEAAVRALDSAEGAGGINLSAITSALGQVDALQSRDSKLGIIGGRLILRRALGNVKLDTPQLLNSAGLGLRDGLKAALGGDVPTSSIEGRTRQRIYASGAVAERTWSRPRRYRAHSPTFEI